MSPSKAVVISPAPDAERIARPLIERFHTHLLQTRVLFLFTTKERKSKGKVVYATAQKLSDLDRYLHSSDMHSIGDGADFLILIGWNEWQRLTESQRAALIDHELNHCAAGEDDDGELVTKIVGHDVEEFSSVIERHGLWEPEVAHFGQVIRQLHLNFVEETIREPVGSRR